MKREIKACLGMLASLLLIAGIAAGLVPAQAFAEPQSSIVIASFASPGPGPTGLAWDGQYLWCADAATNKIYKLTTSGKAITSFSAPGSTPEGLAWDGQYLWCANREDPNTIYKLTASGGVVTSFSAPGWCVTGLTWDGQYLWSTDDVTDETYKLTTSGDVITSFFNPLPGPCTAPRGLAWDGQYLWYTDSVREKIYKLTTSGDLITSFPSPGPLPSGLAWDGEYLWLADGTDTIYKIDVGPTTEVDVDTKYWEDGSYQLRITAQASPGGVSSITILGPFYLDTATVNKPGDPESSDNPKQLYDDGQHWDGKDNDGQWQVVLNIATTPSTSNAITFHITYSDGSTETKQKTIDGVFTETATLVSPPDGSTIDSLTPIFEWTGLSVPVDRYTLQISGVYDIFRVSGDVTSYTIPSGYLSWDKTYDWLISASDVNGNEALTNYDTFTTQQLPALLQKYAPVLYLHEYEKYWPWGIYSMLDKAELWEGKYKKVMDSPTPTKLKSNYNDEKYYLNLKGFSPRSNEIPPHNEWDGYTPLFYGREYSSPNHIVLQYWFFYPFNEWKINRHEGDWEMVQVVLDKAENPMKLCLAWHHDGNWYSWPNIKYSNIEETHPIIFITLGGHGCWSTSGDHNLGLESPLLDALLYDETSEKGKVLYPESVNPSSIKGKKDDDKKLYILEPINNETNWVDWQGKWGEKYFDSDLLGWNGPKSPANIQYHLFWPKRWEDPIGWCNKLEEGEAPSLSHYIAAAQSTLLDISLHAYDEKLHVGETETGEIEATIPGAYIYTPSYYSNDQKEWMWIDSSGNLRFEIKARSSAPQSSHAKRSTKERSNSASSASQSESEGKFNFAFNRYLKEQDLNVTVTYQDVPFTENTIATVDVTPENPMFVMEIDLNGDKFIDEVKYPNYIENLAADIQATIDINPDTLNLQSKGKWITSYIEFPGEYDVNNIRINTILLMINEAVIAQVAESSPSEVNDYDEDGVPDLMVKFDRTALIEYINSQPLSGEVTLTVVGGVNDKLFAGTDTIKIEDAEGASLQLEASQPKFSLSQNYPNPCNPETTIQYGIAEDCHVTLKIYNIAGQLIKTLVDEYQTAGHHTITWYGNTDTGGEVASGIYFYRIKAGDFVSTKKMVVLK